MNRTIETLASEIHRLKTAMRDIYEVYARSERTPKPLPAVELLEFLYEMKDIAAEALREEK